MSRGRWAIAAAVLSGLLGAPPAEGCPAGGYAYGGYRAAAPALGVSARIALRPEPRVQGGHVAAWIGFGGPGLGPGGADEWIQAGIAATGGRGPFAYWEVMRPGRAHPRHGAVAVHPGRHLVTVVELPAGSATWVVLLDWRQIGPRVFLPGSHLAWPPLAAAETRDGGGCNDFTASFQDVGVLAADGRWTEFPLIAPFADPRFDVFVWWDGFDARLTTPGRTRRPGDRELVGDATPRAGSAASSCCRPDRSR